MGKTRLEAFSDAVVAILVTIMVLELRPPRGADFAALRPLAPVFLAYTLSFVFLMIYWNNHHHMFQASRRVDGSVLWANAGLMFALSAIPFTTAWMGGHPWAREPLALYGVSLLAPALAYTWLQSRLLKAGGPGSLLARALGSDAKGKLSVVLYAAGLLGGWFYAPLAWGAYVAVAGLWLAPDRRIERALGDTPAPGESPEA